MRKLLFFIFTVISTIAFAQKPDATVYNSATIVRTANQPGVNTADRIGSLFQDLVYGKISVLDFGLATGTNNYVASVSPAITSYNQGIVFKIQFQNANTASSQLNLNGIGNVLITSDGSTALTSGMIKANQMFWVYYNGSSFQLVGGAGGGTSYTADESTLHLSGTVFSINSSYTGQSSITTLGTITTGIWNGTSIANANLANSTISGIALGNNLANLTIGAELISGGSTTYNGGTAKTLGIQSASVTNAMLANNSITLNAGSNTGYTAPGAIILGSTYTFGATTDNLRFNGLGLNVASPSNGGQISTVLGANNITGFQIKRNTDTSPTGKFLDFQNAASSSLANLDISGNWTAQKFVTSGGSSSQFVKGDGSLDGNTYLTGNQTVTLSGDISGSGTTAITTAIGAGKVTNGMLAGSIAASKLVGTDIATVGTITAGTWNGTTIAAQYGGTGQNSSAWSLGDVPYISATGTWNHLAANSTGTNKYLQSVSSGNPTWQQISFADLSNQTNAWLTASGGTLTGNNTITQGTNTLTFTGSLGTVGANNIYGFNSTVNETSRATASDAFGGHYFTSTTIANAATVDNVGFTIDTTPTVQGAVSTVNANGAATTNYEAFTVTAMVAGTYSNVTPNSTSSVNGTGATFDIVVAGGNSITSIVVHSGSAGSNYRPGETVTFLENQLGGPSGVKLVTIAISAVVTNSLGSNSAAFRINNRVLGSRGITGRLVDFEGGSTFFGAIEATRIVSSSTPILQFRDPLAVFMTSNGTTTNFPLNVTIAGTHTVTGSATLSSISASNSITSTWTNQNTNATSFIYTHTGAFQIQASSLVKAVYGSASTLILGVPSSVTINAVGSGYSNSGGSPVSVTGGTGSGLKLNITTSSGALATVSIAQNGSGYSVNDIVTVVQAGGSGGQVKITAVDQFGSVIALAADTRTLTDATSNQNYASYYSAPTYTLASSTASAWALYYNPTYTSFGTGTKGGIAIVPTGTVNGIGTGSPTAGLDLQASTTGIASFRIRSGTAPSSPNDGEMWYDGTNLFLKSTNNLPLAVNYTAAAPATTGTMTTTLTNTSVMTITPTGACTFNGSGGKAGQEVVFVITTSGTSAFTLTWGTNFKTTGTLSTGTVSGKVFTVSFSTTDGTTYNETSRTGPL